MPEEVRAMPIAKRTKRQPIKAHCGDKRSDRGLETPFSSYSFQSKFLIIVTIKLILLILASIIY